MRRALRLLGSTLIASVVAHPALASDMLPSAASPYEVRLGVFVHDPLSPERGSADVNGEFVANIFGARSDWSLQAFVPRVHAGTTVAFGGRTSNVYAGFTWSLDLTGSIFVEAAVGGAANNGYAGRFAPVGHNAIGCNASFHEAGSLGYRLSSTWSVLATVEHFSNAGLCDANRGLTNFGARLAYHF